MRLALVAFLLVLGRTTLAAQAPAPTPTTPKSVATPALAATQAAAPATPAAPALAAQVRRDDVGFSYSLPSDWESVAPPPAPKAVEPYAALAVPKRDACVEVALTAKHGNPTSVVVVLALPFACYGQKMTANDLANFGAGAAEGMKQTLEVTGPMEAHYWLGSHAVWIERAKGTPKHHPESPFTFEIACTVLEKGAVCWMTMAADAADLKDFEQGIVSLDGEAPVALVPASAFLIDKPW